MVYNLPLENFNYHLFCVVRRHSCRPYEILTSGSQIFENAQILQKSCLEISKAIYLGPKR